MEHSAPGAPQTRTAIRLPVAAFLVAALALAVRFLTFPGLTRGGLWLSSIDDYGHLRRAMRSVRDFPAVPSFDPFLNHPEGGIWIWPPLFDFLIAAPARVFFGTAAEVGEVTFVAALVPPLLGLLTLPALFFLVRRAFGPAEAWVATAAYALLPVAVRYSSFGHADQHVGEALFLVLVAAATLRFLATGATRDVVLLSLALAGAHLMWQGAVFLVPLVAGAVWLAGATSHDRRWHLAGAAALGLASLPIAALTLGRGLPVTYISFGPFQALFLLLFAGLLALCALPRLGTPVAALTGIACAILWPPIGSGLLNIGKASQGAATDLGYLSYPAEWLALIGEFRPLLADGWSAVLRENSLGLLLLPVALALWAYAAFRGAILSSPPADDRRVQLAFLAGLGLAVLAMTLFQKRYAYYLAVPIAVAWGYLTIRLWRWRRFSAVILVALALVSTWPAWARLAATRGAAGPDVFTTLDWIRSVEGGPEDPNRLADVLPGKISGVLAPWSLGHLVTLRGGRPAGADNFGYGFHRQSEVFTTPPAEDDDVARLLRDENFSHLITAEMRPLLPAYAKAVGRSGADVDEMLAARLHGSFERFPVPFLELVHASQTGLPGPGGTIVPRLKIYRVLPRGAAGPEPQKR